MTDLAKIDEVMVRLAHRCLKGPSSFGKGDSTAEDLVSSVRIDWEAPYCGYCGCVFPNEAHVTTGLAEES